MNLTGRNPSLAHYDKLRAIKQKYDPQSLFLVYEGIASDEWDPPTPISPWSLVNNSVADSASSPPPFQEPLPLPLNLSRIGLSAPLSVSFLQFTLGASLWVCGQQIGSLACTGLGYWVVFDAFGVMLGEVVPVWLASSNSKGSSSSMGRKKITRPYG